MPDCYGFENGAVSSCIFFTRSPSPISTVIICLLVCHRYILLSSVEEKLQKLHVVPVSASPLKRERKMPWYSNTNLSPNEVTVEISAAFWCLIKFLVMLTPLSLRLTLDYVVRRWSNLILSAQGICSHCFYTPPGSEVGISPSARSDPTHILEANRENVKSTLTIKSTWECLP